MKKDAVPQDNAGTYAGHKRLLYAIDKQGNYDAVQSSGWEVEEYATLTAVDEYNRLTRQALERVRNGMGSPLEYHMYHSRMDVLMLSQVTGMFQWRIQRHLRAKIFPTLKPSLLKRYADAMGISVNELTSVPGDNRG